MEAKPPVQSGKAEVELTRGDGEVPRCGKERRDVKVRRGNARSEAQMQETVGKWQRETQKAVKCTSAKKKIRQNAKPVTNAKGKWRMRG